MNKYDITLLIAIIFVCLIAIIFIKTNQANYSIAKVYYDGEEVVVIDLSKDEKNEYEIEGENGVVKIETLNNKIRVIEENSPYHLCSKQGYISKSYETIVCLPNKVLIKIEDSNNEIDAVVRWM